ncbi:MAG: biotin--[acetyl-CoA-carboxylase] ligase [Candidatus Nanopelagicales bacterium]|nr:biotin--[acetyl-CoA-carboxylase] ligase [Candidatus Nanopelagicales bacterium]
MSDAPLGPVNPVPSPLVPGPDGRPRSSGVAYLEGWPVDLGTAAVVKSIRKGGGSWRSVTVFPELSSTNSVGQALAAAGCPTGVVIVADLQTAGRGRLDRTWEAPAGTSAMFSVVLLPGGEDHEWGVLPLLAGVAVSEAVEFVTGVRVGLKWPNDLVLRDEDAPSGRGGKVGGILAERDAATGAVILGVGVNVDLAEADLPVPSATSLTLAGIPRPRRAKLIGRALSRIEHWYTAWDAIGADPEALDRLLGGYRDRCTSIGAQLRVARPGAEDLVGTGAGIGPRGELLVAVAGGDAVPVVVGDVVHASAR